MFRKSAYSCKGLRESFMISKFHQNIKIKSCIVAFTAIIIYFINPFGLRTATVKYSEDIFIRLLSPWYDNKGESEITIVLIDDLYIGRTEKQYPVTYTQLSKLFRVIKQHKPSAVFFDIFHHYEHSNGLTNWLSELDQAKFPTLMASLPWIDTPKELSSDNSIRNKLDKVTQLTTVGWRGYEYGHYYPLIIKNPHYKPPEPASNKWLSSAAFDLYKIWCRNNQEQCQVQDKDLNNLSIWSQPMVIQWSSRAASGQEKDLYLKEPCRNVPSSKIRHLFEFFKLEFGRLLPDFFNHLEHQRKTCFHLRTLSAAALIEPSVMDPEHKINTALKGRIVLVGYYLQGSTDRISSPIHGQLPGVFAHAMALDNLINYKDGYWQVSSTLIGSITLSDLIEGLLQGIALALASYYRMWYLSLAVWKEEEAYKDISKEEKTYKCNLIILLCTFLFLFTLSLFLCFYANWGVTNLLTLCLALGIWLEAVVEKNVIPRLRPLKTTK